MSEFLKGNFTVKKPVEESKIDSPKSDSDKLKTEFKKRALASICGSMVYVERTDMTWNGDDDS